MREATGGKTGRWPVLMGLAVALVVILVLGLLLGILLYLTPLPELYLESYALAILTVAVFLGAFCAARTAQCRGLVHGLLVAASVLAVMAILTWIAPAEFCPAALVRFLVAALAAGVVGGMIGVSWH